MAEREAFFLDTPDGPRFAVVTRPNSKPRGAWLYVHPFAEEMNKSRRMAALTAEALAAQGWLVLQGDLKGCGDSAGDFGDASWQDWIDDVSQFWAWLERNSDGVRGLWTLRAGCLVANDWLRQHKVDRPLLVWQPTISGERCLTQFLRLRAVNEALSEADSRGGVKQLREELGAGRAVEVAGYMLRPALAAGLAAARFELGENFSSPVALFEVASSGGTLSPASASIAARLRSANVSIQTEVVDGPAFWQTVEIETAPSLTAASVRALERFAS